MKRAGVLPAAALAGLAACGTVYKSEVIVSGCIAAARTYDETVRAATVDAHEWGPGQARITFVAQTTAEPQTVVVSCHVDNAGELHRMRVGGDRVEGEVLERARKAFSDLARSPAWANRD
jgi:hypothetical protein